ncbi:MAG: amino acid adenylation domain-containing protein, partial [Woeseiaceae bacterium]
MEGVKLSPEQRFLSSYADQGGAQINQVCFPVPDDRDTASIGDRLRGIVSGTEILRTTVVTIPGLREPLQILSENPPAGVEAHDIDAGGNARDGLLRDLRGRVDASTSAWRIDLLRGPQVIELAITAHSLILDLGSLFRFGDALLCRGRAPAGEAEALQFADVSDWQNELLDQPEASGAARQWRQWLDDFRQCPDPDIGISRYGNLCRATAETETARLDRQRFPAGEGTSPQSICRAVWVAMHARAANIAGVRLTAHADGRRHADLAALWGPLERTIPCVLQVDERADLPGLVEALDKQMAERSELANYLPVAAAARDGTRSSLIGFVGLECDGSAVSGMTGPPANAAIVLRVVATAPEVLLTVLYDSRVCPDDFASLMLERFRFCLEHWLDHPATRICDLPLVSATERQRIGGMLSGEPLQASDTRIVDDILERTSANAERIALICGATRLSYGQMGRNAAGIGAALTALGLKPGNVVICGTRSAGFIVAMLGANSAGFAYVPVDSSYPEERIRFIVADANAVCLLCDSSWGGRTDGNLPVLCFDEAGSLVDSKAAEAAPSANPSSPSDNAYLIYTSGSTGQPKGVTVNHANLRSSTRARLVEYERQPGVFLVPSSFAFDSSAAGIYWTLLCGGTLVLPRPGEEADAQGLAKLISTHRVTHTLMLPSLYEAVLKTSAPGELESLNTVIVAGEECPTGVTGKHFSTVPDARLFNEYGPTEATVWCTVYQMAPDDAGGRLPIGRPIAGTTLYILDPAGNSLPLGASGELHVSSAGVAAGYWRRDDLTSERFVPDPFAGEKGRRMYRTGDLVRLNSAGQVEFLGRVDRQVKIRGYRIEPEEIENAMRKVSAVSSAAVTVRETAGSKELAGYYTSDDDALDDLLLSSLKAVLPVHFVPKSLTRLPAMPLMPNGKIDLNALPVPGDKADKGDAAYEGPRNAAERKLQKIFEGTLERPRVGIHDGFFDLGGHSILATIAVASMRQEFGIPIAIRALFDHPTIAGLHEALFGPPATADDATASDATAADKPEAAIPKRALASTGRLSPMQSGLWYLSQLDSGRGAYNLQCGFRLQGHLDRKMLEEALSTVVNNHSVLRSEIVADAEGQPYARIHERVELPFEYVDLRGDPDRVREFLDEAAVQPVATDNAPLLRVALAQSADDEYLLVLVFHHLIVEGWSVTTLLRETGQVYAGLKSGDAVTLLPASIDYWDWNEYEAKRLSGEVLAPQLSYWKRQLAGKAPHLELAQRNHGGTRGGMVGRRLPAELVQELEAIAKERGATLFMVLLGAYQVLLHRYTGETDIRVGVPINTRTRPELERTAGLFINTLIMRSRATPTLGFEAFLARLKDDVLDAFSNMDTPLETVSRSLGEHAGQANKELFQAMFALQNVPPMALALPGVASTPLEHDELHSGAGKVDISLVVEPGAGAYHAWIEFDGRAFDRGRSERFLQHFEVLLGAIVRRPAERIGRLDILPASERATLLQAFNGTDALHDERVAVRRVWEQIEKRPDSLAVSNSRESLSYHDLGRSAARVVTAILDAEHPAGSVIAVCMQRSADLVATLVGSHLAGCCYVPIDPEYPDERIEYIVNDSAAAMVFTDTPGRFDKLSVRAAIVDASSMDRHAPADAGSFRWPSNDDLAYIVYTSGSTGVPKGVRLAHRGVANLVAWEEKTYGITPQDRGTMLAGLGFDATVWEVWPCLATGAALYQIDDDIRANPAAVYEWLARNGITMTFLPTPLAEVVLDLPVPDNIALRYLFTGGDALHAREWPRLPFPVVNHYGPSENTVIATAGVVNPDLPPDVPPGIGKPIDNTRAYILDDALQPVPVGVAGELCLAGYAIAYGYVNRDEQSADRFVANPYGEGHWARLYRTGDRAYYNADGTIEFLGRMDQQVKVRGFRIELGDIEATLTRHPAVANAAVTVWNVSRDDQRIAACIVPAQGSEGIDSVSLRKFVRKSLPSYMVPTYFTVLDELPLTRNGKVDRKALPLP